MRQAGIYAYLLTYLLTYLLLTCRLVVSAGRPAHHTPGAVHDHRRLVRSIGLLGKEEPLLTTTLQQLDARGPGMVVLGRQPVRPPACPLLKSGRGRPNAPDESALVV